LLRGLVGKFERIEQYRDIREFVRIIKATINNPYYVKKIIIFPDNIDICIIMYLLNKNKEAKIYLVKDDRLLKPSIGEVLRIIKNEGFIEIYDLGEYEYEVDLEVLTNYEILQGIKGSHLTMPMSELIKNINDSINYGHKKESIPNTKAETKPIFDEHLSKELSDILFRAQIMMSKYKIKRVKLVDLLNHIMRIINENNNIILHCTIFDYDLWIKRTRDNRVGAILINRRQGKTINSINNTDILLNRIKNIIEQMPSKNMDVNIFIYLPSKA